MCIRKILGDAGEILQEVTTKINDAREEAGKSPNKVVVLTEKELAELQLKIKNASDKVLQAELKIEL